MQNGKSAIWRSLTLVAIVNLSLIINYGKAKAEASQSAVPALPADIPVTADRYSVLMGGNPAGQQAVWAAPDSLHIFF